MTHIGSATGARGSALTGTGTLIGLILRRDRIRIPAWILAISGMLVAIAASFPDLYRTAQERQARAGLMGNPASIAFSGPGHGLDNYTLGAMLANEMLGFTAIFVALMSVLLMVRHTRAEEAVGRAELIRSAAVGRYATIVAALVVVIAANLLLGAVVAAGLASLGIESMGWAGSWLYGAALAAVGLAFAGIAALTAQVTEHARGASGMGGAAIALAYSLRAFGDMAGNTTVAGLSPIGWAQATRVYVDDRWWPLLPAAGLMAACTAVALALSTRRDVGAGLVAPSPGPATAPGLSSPLAMARRMQRSTLAWWGFSLVLFGLVYGTLVGEVATFVEDMTALQEYFLPMGNGSLTDSFLAMIVSLLAMSVSVYAVLVVQRLRTEETSGRAEPILATAVSQVRWSAAYLLVAMAGSGILLLLGVGGMGVSAALILGDPGIVPRLLGAALAYLPAIGVVAGLTLALYGLAPRLIPLAWVVVIYAITVGVMGPLIGLPQWAYELSAFEQIPRLPAEAVSATPLIALTVIAVDLAIIGIAGFRRRDLQSAT